ncbi:MAG TPA: PadR family transcriptional regulator [Ktedonosporobacter sp.]|nr:PadR family transcriptional regulator [Ktedonosporobacter sp.]
MHKMLLVLGMLLHQPLHGYEIHRIVRAHGELYADLKKANLYYLLERLAKDGDLRVETEPSAHGVRGERMIYELTDQGRRHFKALLRETLLNYEPVHTGVDIAVVFLAQLPPAEGLQLLVERRQAVVERRAIAVADLGDQSAPLMRIASDHLLSLIDAELAWIDRSLAYLHEIGWATSSPCKQPPPHTAKES